MRKNFERDYRIVVNTINGMTNKAIAEMEGLSLSRPGQIFWKFTRALRSYDHMHAQKLRAIFNKEKYPHVWRTDANGEYFSGYDIRLDDWRAEKVEVFKLIDEIAKED